MTIALAACSASPAPPEPPHPAVTTPGRSQQPSAHHVFVIVMENHSLSEIVGRPEAPYLNQLARRFGLASNYHGVAHPSLPNYLAIAGGSTFRIASDCTSCSAWGPSVAGQLDAAGLSWRVYAEGIPRPCFTGASSGRYAKKHNPFAYFPSITRDARCPGDVVGIDRLDDDLRGNTRSLSFVVPDLCHDMHDCPVAAGDAWLAGVVPKILASAAWRAGGVLAITFDEDDGSSSNRVATIVARPGMRAGQTVAGRMDHYWLLRAIEDELGVPPIGRAMSAGNLFRAFVS